MTATSLPGSLDVFPTRVDGVDRVTADWWNWHSSSITALSKAVLGQTYNVKGSYGAKGDGQIIADGAMGAGSAILTSASALFTSADAGKVITVKGAAAAGAVLGTTILSYQSPTQVTLATTNASGGAISNKGVCWATDDTAAIKAAVAAAIAAGASGGVIYSPPGIYGLSSPIGITGSKGLTFQGAGTKTSTAPTAWFANGGAAFMDLGDGASSANDYTGKLTLLDMLWDGRDLNIDMVRNRNIVSNPGRFHWERQTFWAFGTGYGFRDAVGGVTTQDGLLIDVLLEFGGTGLLLMNGAWTLVNTTFAFLTKGVDIRGNNKAVYNGCVWSGCTDDIYFGDTGITYTNPHLFVGCWYENSTDAVISSSTAIVNVDVTFDSCRLHTNGAQQIYMPGMTQSSIVLRQCDFGGVAPKIIPGAAGSGNVVYSENSRPLNRVGIVASPINSTRNSIGPHLLAADTFAAAPLASTDYLVQGCKGLWIFVTGGTGVSVGLKDRLQGTVTTVGAGTTPIAVYVPAGMFINFGAFSVAPTLVVMVD